MIYYICLFWSNENDEQEYLDYHYIKTLTPLVDADIKNEFIESFNHQYHKFAMGTDNVAIQALTNNDEDDLHEKEHDIWHKHFHDLLLSYNINMDDINKSFYYTEGDKYNEMSS